MDTTPSLTFPNSPINPRPSMMDRVRSRLFGTHPPGETGEQNAQRFVQTVATLAKDERVILMYPTYTKASYVGGMGMDDERGLAGARSGPSEGRAGQGCSIP